MKVRSRLLLRRLVRHPWQLILGITGVALGVSIVLAIDLTNASAERAFLIANQSLAGDITHQLTPVTGFIDESVYIDLRIKHGLRQLLPVVAGRVRTAADKQYQLLGFDPVATIGMRSVRLLPGTDTAALTLMREPGSVFIPASMQEQLQVSVNSQLAVTAKGKQHTLSVAGIIADTDGLQGLALPATVVADISTAQAVLGMEGKLTSIDLILDEAEAQRLAAEISSSLQLLPAGARGNAMTQITRAFRTNLTALSLLALAIGAFLIYNTMTISVLQRRELIATLRTLGLLRHELLLLILIEALLLAGAGLLAGWALGTGLSHYLIRLASQTINDLYFVTEIQSVYLDGWSYAKAGVLALGATLLASYFPVRDALAIAPELTRSRSRLELRTRSGNKKYLFAALLFAAGASVILLLSGKSIVAGFVALACLIMAFALLAPLLLIALVYLARPLLTGLLGLAGTAAARGVLAALSRTQVAVTVLAIAISATIGVSIMIGSFRVSVQDWLSGLLQADVYISPADGDQEAGIDQQLLTKIRQLPGVNKIASARWRDLWRADHPVQLLVRDIDAQIFSAYAFMDGGDADRWRRFATTDSVIVSQPYAYHNDVGTGDVIELPTDQGPRDFTIIGVYQDYSSDRGIVSLHRNIYDGWWADRQVTSLSLYHDASLDSNGLVAQLNQGLLQPYNLVARSNRGLREASLQIFDRTFVITDVLRMLTVVIAVIGILGALMAIQLERGREFAVLRVQGVTPRGLQALVLTESGVMGAAAGVIAVPLGIMLAAVLIYIINRRSFGWTMDFILAPQYLLAAVGLGLIAGLMAGVYPAWRMSAVAPARSLHYE